MGVKSALFLLILLTTAAILARQDEEPQRTGVIYGIVIARDGQPAADLHVAAEPQGVPIATKLPGTKTDSAGRYRFEKLQLGRYSVFAQDEEARYPGNRTSFYDSEAPAREINLTAEHPEAEFRVDLPPKAGFLQIHLTDRTTRTEFVPCGSNWNWPTMPTAGSARAAIQTTSCCCAGEGRSSPCDLRWIRCVGSENSSSF